jgi:hypothetical protein
MYQCCYYQAVLLSFWHSAPSDQMVGLALVVILLVFDLGRSMMNI